MNQPIDVTQWRTDPEAALSTLASYDGPILVDLDETLYLRNSTEDFIDSAWPRLPALLVMRFLDVLKPWRWTGGDATRDVWRVRAVTTLSPWTFGRWRKRVAGLASQYTNRPLLETLAARDSHAIIATVGFQPIVDPLVRAMGLGELRLIAPTLHGFADRRRGKLDMVREALGDATLKQALVLTDSVEDAPLLRACGRPLRAVWPEARYRRAFSGVYFPGQYLTLVKRPGERYILRGILQEDFAYWVLASLELAAVPYLHVFGLLCLLLSFWAIYERGYVDNDRVAAKFEADPKLSAAFHREVVATPTWPPWVWASVSGAIGVVLLRWPVAPSPLDYAKWAGTLIAVYLCFKQYNRLDKSTRVWLFSVLQFARGAAFTVIVPVLPIGAAGLGAHVLARWVPYYLYRLGSGQWPEAQTQTMRLLFFVVLAALLAISQGIGVLLNATTLGLLAWSVFRANQEIRHIVSAAVRIDRKNDDPPQ